MSSSENYSIFVDIEINQRYLSSYTWNKQCIIKIVKKLDSSSATNAINLKSEKSRNSKKIN